MGHTTDSSTYSAVFAVLLIALIVLVIGYKGIMHILNGWKSAPSQESIVDTAPETEIPTGVVLYENLSDEEANRIINQLLQSGEKNLEKIEEIEVTILE